MTGNKRLLLKKTLILWSIIGIQSCIPGRTKSGGESKVIHPSTTSHSTQRTTTTQTQPTEEQIAEEIEKLKKQAPTTETAKNNIIAKANKELADSLTTEQQQTLEENSKALGFSIAETIELAASIGINVCNEEFIEGVKLLSTRKLELEELAEAQEALKPMLESLKAEKAWMEEVKKARAANVGGGN
jgi:hypothetical protein